jgi:hypothetical protein
MGHPRVLRGYFQECYTPSVRSRHEKKLKTTAIRLTMYHCTQVIMLGVLAVCCSALLASQGVIPFTPAGIASLPGNDVCSLGEAFPNQLGVYLDLAKAHAVQYREQNGITAIFLLSKPTTHCGIVDTSLDLTPLIRKGETVEFKCYTNHEGGTTWGKWGHVVGLANNRRGQKRFVKARLAWRVDIENKRFQPIMGEAVQCDTSGYTD